MLLTFACTEGTTMGKRQHFCKDCDEIFRSRRMLIDHAFSAVHMRDRTCISCYRVFETAHGLDLHKTLHKNHRPEPPISKPAPPKPASGRGIEIPHISGQMNHTETSVTTPHPSHFSTRWWRESGDMEAALRERPNHGYKWASPALSEAVYTLLESEILDSERRRSEGFPLLSPLRQYERRTAANTGNRARTASANSHPLPLPQPSPFRRGPTYAALVLDCEMVELDDGAQDLVSVSAVDFLSGRIVLHSLVQPTGRVRNWRTRVTGVTPRVLSEAKSMSKDNENEKGNQKGEGMATPVLRGWPEARERILAVVDASTILVGHALPNDLKMLRIAADRVVDSAVLTARAAFGAVDKFPRRWGLKSACRDLVGVDVQMRRAHDPLEDALATRELVLWCLTHPARLLEWGHGARGEYLRLVEVRRELQRAEAKRKAEEEEERRKRVEGGVPLVEGGEGFADLVAV
ncbi:ribonuclease H-like domain-containing protein [Xylaria sp. FL1777]|nr:ribonuclease H-like domain-containing protein [Xylaria sp. FL1777]